MYNEILDLYAFCKKIGIKCNLINWFDGYAIMFNGGCNDIMQCCLNSYAYKGYMQIISEITGCVNISYAKAKRLIFRNKDFFIKVVKIMDLKNFDYGKHCKAYKMSKDFTFKYLKIDKECILIVEQKRGYALGDYVFFLENGVLKIDKYNYQDAIILGVVKEYRVLI